MLFTENTDVNAHCELRRALKASTVEVDYQCKGITEGTRLSWGFLKPIPQLLIFRQTQLASKAQRGVTLHAGRGHETLSSTHEIRMRLSE